MNRITARKKKGLLLSVIAVALSASTLFAAGQKKGLEISPESIDIGTLDKAEAVSGSVLVTNHWRSDARISVRGTCGCLSVKVGGDGTLPAGAQTKVKYEYDARSKSLGAFTDRFYVNCVHDGFIDVYPVILRGSVERLLEVEPSVLDFGDAKREGRSKRDFVVTWRGKETGVSIDSTSALAPYFELTQEGTSETGAVSKRFTLSLDESKAGPGPIDASLAVLVSGKGWQRSLKVIARGTVWPGCCAVQPASVKMGFVKPGSTVICELYVRDLGGFAGIKSVSCDIGAVQKWQLTEDYDIQRLTVTMTVPDSLKEGPVGGTITLVSLLDEAMPDKADDPACVVSISGYAIAKE
jgi:hypothetical protein